MKSVIFPKGIFLFVIFYLFNISVLLADKNIVTFPFYRENDNTPIQRTVNEIYSKSGKSFSQLNSSEKVTLLLDNLFAGPTDEEKRAGFQSPIPSNAKLEKIELINKDLLIYISRNLLQDTDSPDAIIEYTNKAIEKTLYNLPLDEYPESVNMLIEGKDGVYRKAYDYTIPGKANLPTRAPKYEPYAEIPPSVLNSFGPVLGRVPTTRPIGALSGKRVGINVGHGWWWDKDLAAWSFQRGNISGYIEDLGNWHRCLLYTARYLWNAGADVFPSREWDCNTTELIFNNDNGSPEYTEAGIWSTSGSNGYNSTYRFISADSTGTSAAATWRIIVPHPDYYAVYQYSRPGTNRVTDALYTINHSGGQTNVKVDQKILTIYTGSGVSNSNARWIYMGNYYFDTGTTTITLSNYSLETSASVVIADAIRLGGGMAVLNSITTTGPPSITKPRWQAAAEYWTKYIGAPSAVYNPGGANTDDGTNDWYSRPQHAIWEDCDAYLMVHSNAFDGTASGTRSIRHSSATTLGTYKFETTVHYQIMNDVKAYWDNSWSGSVSSGSYAELGYLGSAGIPGALFEVAFHDNTAKDNPYLRNAKFEDILGRAFYKGVVRYFYSNPVISPLPPINLRITNLGDGTVRLSWSPQIDPIESTANPTTYRIYKSTNGKGFDNGVYTSSTTYIYSGLTPNTVYYFQITAVNTGGESMPTETLGCRVKSSGNAPILVINGYDRVDENNIGIDRTDANNPKVNQTFDYIIQHGDAIKAYGTWFDSACNEAVANGLINLSNYQAVVWISGQESTVDETFNSTEQSRMTTYLNTGGKLFVSGSEIAWDLGRTSGSADSTFLANYLKAKYVGDDAATYTISVPVSGIFNGLSSMSFDNGGTLNYNGSGGTYNVAYPDQITTNGGSAIDLNYSGGSGGNAAIEYSGTFKVVYLGFPFETITSQTARNNVMNRVLTFFGIGTPVNEWMLY